MRWVEEIKIDLKEVHAAKGERQKKAKCRSEISVPYPRAEALIYTEALTSISSECQKIKSFHQIHT